MKRREDERMRREEEREFRREMEQRRITDREEALARERKNEEVRELQRLEDREEARKVHQILADTLKDQQQGRERALVIAQGRRLKMGTDIPTLPKLSDPSGIELFLDQFKKDMVTFEVPPAQWTTNLRPLLDTKSMEFTNQVIQGDFELLAKELTRLHGITPEFHGRTWKNLVQGTGEDLVQWNVRMEFALMAWMKDFPTREDALDRILLERLMASLDPETQRWTRNTRPKTAAEAAETANLFQQHNRVEVNQFRPMGPRNPPPAEVPNPSGRTPELREKTRRPQIPTSESKPGLRPSTNVVNGDTSLSCVPPVCPTWEGNLTTPRSKASQEWKSGRWLS